ncbi:MAG TPA: hypothetical protein VLD61_04495 [Methylomirabilota bacterium]|nr:hypothetical protein [Methylomirabilota bacterium]
MAVTPQFPGGMDVAPEVAPGGGCAHGPCTCAVEAGRAYCCRACARAGEDADRCRCGHFGCTDRAF